MVLEQASVHADVADGAGKDAAVGADIRLLGRMLGDVVRQQAGDAVFELVEDVRRRAVDARRDGRSPLDGLAGTLPGQSIEDQLHLIRAFGWLSMLANTAEDVHHERRRRYHRDHGSSPQVGSIAATLTHLADVGVDAGTIGRLVHDLRVTPVITAHPTEVRRQTVLELLADVSAALVARSAVADGSLELAAIDRRLQLRILTLWNTAVLRLSKLRVRDEINEALRYYEASLFEVVPALEAAIEQTVRTRWGIDVDASGAVRMGSWIGGDRDGNPFVTADVLRTAVASQALTSFTHHLRQLNALARDLPISMRLVTPTPELLALAEESGDASPFRADEPYRRALRGMYARLFALADVVLAPFGTSIAAAIPPPPVPRPAYTRFDELADDLAVVAHSLRSHGAGALADDMVEPLCRSVVTFGAHLCGLDLRQNAAVHEEVIAELLAVAGVEPAYGALVEAERVTLLVAELASPRPLHTSFAHYTERTATELAVLRGRGRGRAPSRARCDPALRHLRRGIGQRRARGRRAAARGRAAPPARGRADEHRHRPAVRDHRRPPSQRRHAGRAPRGTVVPAAARRPRRPPGGDDRLLRLQQGRRLPHVELDALGGTGSAGRASPTSTACGCACSTGVAAPSGVVAAPPTRRSWPSRQVRSTARSASPSRVRWWRPSTPSRRRHGATSRRWWPRRSRRRLASTATSVPTAIASVRSWTGCRRLRSAPIARWCTTSRRSPRFFGEITPIREISTLNIGSRPASRTGSDRIEDLRAIPWVFGWTQCRLMLPGWYGCGSAFDAVAQEGCADAELLATMFDRWPFFRSVIDNMGMVLAKADLEIGMRYANALVPDGELRTRIMDRIAAELHRTAHWHERITGSADPLANNPSLARSIRNRYPYLDPLHVMQIELLARHRAGERGELVERGIQLTINAIATGLRNSG